MNKYVVLCDCDGLPDRRVLAWIDDDRPDGGVRIRSNQAFRAVGREKPSTRGDTGVYTFACRGCGRAFPPTTESTVAEIIDTVAPHLIEDASVPALTSAQPTSSEDRRRAHDDVTARLRGRVDPSARAIPGPARAVYEVRRVIPFGVLCNVVSRLRTHR